MKLETSLGVDAGNITLFKKIEKLELTEHYSKLVETFVVEKESKVIIIVNCYLGRIKRIFTLEEGTYFLGDACYIIPDKDWLNYLTYTNFMEFNNNTINTGGDGCFKVSISINPLDND